VKRGYSSHLLLLCPRPAGLSLLAFAALALLATGAARAGQRGASLTPGLEKVFQEGVQAEKAGQLDEAEKAFLQVLRQGGDVAFVHNNLGIVYQQRRDHLRAIAQFREAVRLDADYAAPRALLGASLLALGKVGEATRELETAVKLAPREPLVRLELARAYERAGNPTGMVDQYYALRQLSPQDPEYAYQLGSAYLRLSAGCLRQILELDPRSARAYQVRAEIYRNRGHIEQAIRAFRRALEIDPAFPGIHLALAQIYLEQGRAADARQELDRELAVVPESVAALALKKRLEAMEPAPQ
jgi:tetratricopeptide (TPR) repeat protein